MKAKITTETKNYAHCPTCKEKDSTIDHLKNGFESMWYCDQCGYLYKITKENGIIEVEPTKERSVDMFVFLKNANVGLIVKGSRNNPKAESYPTELEVKEYYYNEGTCPTNYLSEVIAIINLDDGDIDPHGIFEFCGMADFPVDFKENGSDYDFSKYIEYFNY